MTGPRPGSSLLLIHPTGNTFVRALISELQAQGWDFQFATTVGFGQDSPWPSLFPGRLRNEFRRRTYPLPRKRLLTRPWRELGRLAAARCGAAWLAAHEAGPWSVDAVYRDLDVFIAGQLGQPTRPSISTVYAYEDGALETFRAARRHGMRRIYELPIAYWDTTRKLLAEEAARWPQWEGTLGGTQDSPAKLARKTEELSLAEVVVCPSLFVWRSLPEKSRQEKTCIVSEFGSPAVPANPVNRPCGQKPSLRLLFAGSMSQRKGLADLFAAMKLLHRSDVQLVVMGSLIHSLDFYRAQYRDFLYEPPRPHADVLRLMQQCDVLVLPSIVEGRALVQQEALSCGLPLIVTAHAGGEDLVEEGQTGFLVPIRSPEAIAEKIHWFADHPGVLTEMRRKAREKAAQYTWPAYAQKILKTIGNN